MLSLNFFVTCLIVVLIPGTGVIFTVSTGLTAELPPEGVYVMAMTMFMGRIGTVTLAAALASSERRQLFKRPEERPIVG